MGTSRGWDSGTLPLLFTGDKHGGENGLYKNSVLVFGLAMLESTKKKTLIHTSSFSLPLIHGRLN